MPYFLRHYGRFCSSILVFDNLSTDGTPDIVRSYPNTQVIPFDTHEQLIEEVQVQIRNQGWKSNRQFDWQIVVDTDEFIYHPQLIEELDFYKRWGISVLSTIGYDMIAEFFPDPNHVDYRDKQIYEIISTGKLCRGIGKNCIFDPKKIEDMGFWHGSHRCEPKGEIRLAFPAISLLHYRYFGFENYRQDIEMTCERLGWNRDDNSGAGQAIERYKNIRSEKEYKDYLQLWDPVDVLQFIRSAYRSL